MAVVSKKYVPTYVHKTFLVDKFIKKNYILTNYNIIILK